MMGCSDDFGDAGSGDVAGFAGIGCIPLGTTTAGFEAAGFGGGGAHGSLARFGVGWSGGISVTGVRGVTFSLGVDGSFACFTEDEIMTLSFAVDDSFDCVTATAGVTAFARIIG